LKESYWIALHSLLGLTKIRCRQCMWHS